MDPPALSLDQYSELDAVVVSDADFGYRWRDIDRFASGNRLTIVTPGRARRALLSRRPRRATSQPSPPASSTPPAPATSSRRPSDPLAQTGDATRHGVRQLRRELRGRGGRHRRTLPDLDGDPSRQDGRLRRESSACVLAVANQKGGVGKTTTVINLGAYLAALVSRCSCCRPRSAGEHDRRPRLRQGHGDPSVYEALLGQQPLAAGNRPDQPQLVSSLVPSALRLAGAEVEMVGLMAREQRLARVLQPVLGDYDFVLIDCSPSLGLLTVNALTAAHGVLIPIQCEYLALEALGQLLNTVQR